MASRTSKKSERVRSNANKPDLEAHSRHLKRQLESLERDNHASLNDVEGLISIALAQQEEEGIYEVPVFIAFPTPAQCDIWSRTCDSDQASERKQG